MIVVSDTSPLNYLAILGRIDLLPTLYGKVVIPDAVLSELRAARHVPPARELGLAPPPWLVVVPVPTPDPALAYLDAGEQAAITLARSLGANVLLCDERRGRLAAQRQSLRVTGTLGVLQLAAIRGLLDFMETVRQLTSTTNFRVSPSVIDEAAKAINTGQLGPNPPDRT